MLRTWPLIGYVTQWCFPLMFFEFSDKNITHYSKRARTCNPVTFCVRDQDATTAQQDACERQGL